MTTSSQPESEPKNNLINHYVPILVWLQHYEPSWLSVDVIAGLTLWGLFVPEAMAYAGIAGLLLQAGL